MEQTFYRQEIETRAIGVLVPNERDRQLVNQVIYDQLCLGQSSADLWQAYLRISDELAVQGAEAVILDCTEIALLIKQSDTLFPLFDTTKIHAKRAPFSSLV